MGEVCVRSQSEVFKVRVIEVPTMKQGVRYFNELLDLRIKRNDLYIVLRRKEGLQVIRCRL